MTRTHHEPEYHWTVPVAGDGREANPAHWPRGGWNPAERRTFRPVFRDERGDRFGAFDYLSAVGRAADVAGFDGATVPYDPAGEDSWITAGTLLRESRWLRVGAEFHPGFATPVYAAKLSVTLQRFTDARLDWHVVVDADETAQRALGDFVTGDDRYARADEFLTVARGVWHERAFSYEGRFHQVVDGGFFGPLSGVPFPRVHLTGTSDAALALSAKHADVHVFALDADPAVLAGHIARLRAAAGARRDGIGIGLRVPLLVREDANEAAEALTRRAGTGAGTGAGLSAADNAVVWHGFDAFGHRDTAGLVGSYDGVAARLAEYRETLGITRFFLAARPAAEEAYRIGEHLLPRLHAAAPTPAKASA
ncbi:LLM class flavin-dependent oxidoreductase [Yinghuangia aomiensis]